MGPPRACNIFLACTLWFNVLFYALLARFARSQTPGAVGAVAGGAARAARVGNVAVHCARGEIWSALRAPPSITIAGDIIFHWLPLVVTLLVLYRHSS